MTMSDFVHFSLPDCRLRLSEPWIGQHQWNNNNCESANHLLKLAVDWKPQRVTDLIDHLRRIVRNQYDELRRAMTGLGDFQLTAPFLSRHIVKQRHWNTMPDEGKDCAFRRLMIDDGTRVEKKTVTSSDGNLMVIGSPRIARKKGQRRRATAERTTVKKL